MSPGQNEHSPALRAKCAQKVADPDCLWWCFRMENQRARKLRFLLDESSRWESSEIDGRAEIVTKKGKPVSVILPIKRYQELLELLERLETPRGKP